MLRRWTFLLIVTAVTPTAMIAQATWKMDKSHTAVRFRVSHYVISEVTGIFKEFDVTLHQPNQDFTDAQLEVTIKSASIFTDNEKRDAHLKTADFLDAEKYPEITFKSTSFSLTGKDKYKIAGDLTIRGVTKSVVLDAVKKGEVQNRGRTIVAFNASTEVNRFDFGVSWGAKLDSGGLVAGEMITIDLTYEGIKQ